MLGYLDTTRILVDLVFVRVQIFREVEFETALEGFTGQPLTPPKCSSQISPTLTLILIF